MLWADRPQTVAALAPAKRCAGLGPRGSREDANVSAIYV